MPDTRTLRVVPGPADPPEAPRGRTETGPTRGLTVADVAQRYRVSSDKVRLWIAKGELRAINTSSTLIGKPRWVIMPEALAAFEQRRTGGPAPKQQHRRRRKTGLIDYFPD